MLSVAKVKLHGLKDDRWSTEDKLSQYKGLINLYKRDKKIVTFDYTILKRKTRKELYDTQKDIAQKREQLSNLIKGDRQQLRNQLQEHRQLQLKYQNLHPKEALERIAQEAFGKRKQLDVLKYKTKQKSNKLTDAKLHLSVLEDRIKYGRFLDHFPAEKQAEIITGKVQDAILKKEAALVVHQTYKDILNIMRKDQVYYQAVLMALQGDALEQGKCLIRTTELGQLAMEYLDDRRDEYVLLESTVKHDMKQRLQSLSVVQEQVQQMHGDMHLLIRRDSDINLCKQKLAPLVGELELKKEVKEMEEKLDCLKRTTEVTHINKIFDSFNDQKRQKERLKELSKKLNTERDILENRHNHAQLQLQAMVNSVTENTFTYMETKNEIRITINEQKERKKKALDKIKRRNEILGQIRTALLQIDIVCKVIAEQVRKPMLMPASPIYTAKMPEQPEHSLTAIIDGIHKKLTALVQHHVDLIGDALFHAEDNFQAYIQRVSRNVIATYRTIVTKEESLIEEVSRDDTEVLSRAEVKSRSAKVVETNQKSEFDLPT